MNTASESNRTEVFVLEPTENFKQKAHLSSREAFESLYQQSISDPETFWFRMAEGLHWFDFPSQALDLSPTDPWTDTVWFPGGMTNMSFNCLDRHILQGRGNQAALIWQAEASNQCSTITYLQLHRRVCQLAEVLVDLGVGAKDRVAIYMGQVPEAVVAMLACARIGAVHTVVFGGFAAEALQGRLQDSGAKVVLTQQHTWRRGQRIPLKDNVDKALQQAPMVKHVLVLDSNREGVPGRDHDWNDLVDHKPGKLPAVPLPSEHPLFILYTSGTTGKPKGIVHSTAGFMLNAQLTCQWVFDLKPDDVYWCTADVGWITGHTYVGYGPLLCGATQLLYEGALNQPDFGRPWALIEQHKVSVFYTSPTAIRSFIRAGDHFPMGRDLASLRLLGSVGEPINPDVWLWYHRMVGKERCPIVDTWWQTETGAIMMTTLPGIHAMQPGSCGLPWFGVVPKIFREDGTEANDDEPGLLVIAEPWPSMLRGIWGEPERLASQYLQRFPGFYFTGDGARRAPDGYHWISGRVDDVVNVSGHRLGTAEIESVLVSHDKIAEAAVVGRPDALKGQALVAFVVPKLGVQTSESLVDELKEKVASRIGRFARPDEIRLVSALPKTRSGKIMRRFLKDIAAGQALTGDVSTLEDSAVLIALSQTNP